MATNNKINIFWFRRDLRFDDNHGLYHALSHSLKILPLFIFDKNILDKLEDSKDARITFIQKRLIAMNKWLNKYNSAMMVRYGDPVAVFEKLLTQFKIEHVYANHDYEPYAIERDTLVKLLLEQYGIGFKTLKDHVIFEKSEILKANDQPYTVFTPYSKKWKEQLKQSPLKTYPSEIINNWIYRDSEDQISLEEIGFSESLINFPSDKIDQDILNNYDKTRDFPAKNGTSRLGIHLRFGTISIRKLVKAAIQYNETYLNELIWREFYASILWHFPETVERNFNRSYDRVQWRNNEEEFKKWCEGKTGYPIVDAGMRELNKTGYMHNRVRMITASFLTKHLLIDWRWGEAYFASKLLDFELASNVGGWQWAAGTGVDAVPYFRIFNPQLQQSKFDPDLEYVTKWVPEFGTEAYPDPIVDHAMARERAIQVFKSALKS